MEIISNAIFREKAIYEDLICVDVETSDGDLIHYIDSDLTLLFNQKRLESLGQTQMLMYLESIAPRIDSLSQLRSSCTDDELLSLIKSRHIQSPSDLLLWSKYLDNQLNLTKEEMEKLSKSKETIKFDSNDNTIENENT